MRQSAPPTARPTRIAAAALALLAALATLAALPQTARAGATTDGSVGAVQTLSGRFTVPQALGTVRGSKLLHSFADFAIAKGETATFTTQDAALRHVIARVTGGQASVLEGPLQLQAAGGAKPDFWLLNPSGVLVGAGASFDVPAGLHLGAAHTIVFADGSRLAADASPASSLTVAAPEAFGFLPAPTAAAGPLVVRDTALQPALGAPLSLAGGELRIERAQLATLAAPLRVQAAGTLTLGAGAELSASGVGAGAPLQLQAAQMRATQGAMASAWNYGSSTGSGLQVEVSGALALDAGAFLASYALGEGMAGPLAVKAGTLSLAGRGEFGPTAIITMGSVGAPGALDVRVEQALTLAQGASLGSSSRSLAAPGPVTVQAGSIDIQGRGEATTISSLASGGGPAAALDVQASGAIMLADGGQIFGATLGGADAGRVRVSAAQIDLQGAMQGDLHDGSRAVTGIYANVLGAGRGGALDISADTLNLRAGARISTSTNHDAGSAGHIAIRAGKMQIDGRVASAGIDSYAYGAAGDAGSVDLQVEGELALLAGGMIAAGTFGSGSPGAIVVRAGSLRIDGRDAGPSMTGIAGDALFSGVGAAIDVQAGEVSIGRGGTIATSTASGRDGQPLRVQARTLRIDGGKDRSVATGILADAQGSGNAGSITLQADDLEVVDEGMVSTSTVGAGRGGALRVQAERVRLSGSGGLLSVAAAEGDAGLIELQARQSVELGSGGHIVTNSGGQGAAGDVRIETARLRIGGRDDAAATGEAPGPRSRIASRALPDSAGRAGRIEVVAGEQIALEDGALVSIGNDALAVREGASSGSLIRLQAPRIALQGAEITAAASAAADAGAIELASSGAIRLTDAGLHTSAMHGRGGPIRLEAAGPLVLRNSLVTTSVLARDGGDGGTIRIASAALALASGFVQANTAAARASGGTVTIDAAVLVPDGNHVFVGGERIADFRPNAPGHNVIQAAAPDGVAGRLDVTRPELNLSGSLAALIAQPVDFGLLRPDICDVGTDSSFTVLGRGALPAPASAPLRSR